jgi:predicted MFS family arabinose efflux permease
MAILVALRNVATDASTFTGGQLFTHLFHNHYQPLVMVAFLAPAASLLVLPMIKEKKADDAQSPDLHQPSSGQESVC